MRETGCDSHVGPSIGPAPAGWRDHARAQNRHNRLIRVLKQFCAILQPPPNVSGSACRRQTLIRCCGAFVFRRPLRRWHKAHRSADAGTVTIWRYRTILGSRRWRSPGGRLVDAGAARTVQDQLGWYAAHAASLLSLAKMRAYGVLRITHPIARSLPTVAGGHADTDSRRGDTPDGIRVPVQHEQGGTGEAD
jgi:hypothetical protein